MTDQGSPVDPIALVAHRGGGADGVENALSGLARLEPWVRGVEVDARLTSDGIPVLMHDAAVDRTTDGHGEVAAMTSEAISRCELGDGSSVPTLASYLRACAAADLEIVLVDAKEERLRDLAAVVDVVTSSPVAAKCVTLVRSVPGLHLLRQLHPSLRLGCLGLTEANVTTRLEAAADVRAELLLVYPGDEAYLRNRKVTTQVHEAGFQVGASTIDGRLAFDAALADRCDLVLTDAVTTWPWPGKISSRTDAAGTEQVTGHAGVTTSQPPGRGRER